MERAQRKACLAYIREQLEPRVSRQREYKDVLHKPHTADIGHVMSEAAYNAFHISWLHNKSLAIRGFPPSHKHPYFGSLHIATIERRLLELADPGPVAA